MTVLSEWVAKALECGFDYAAPVEVANLEPIQSVRDACAQNRCRSFGKNWGCPPGVGTLEECAARMKAFERAILVQTVGKSAGKSDYGYIMDAGVRHNATLTRFAEVLRVDFPEALCLGAGGCTICRTCAYPEPCRFPDKQMSSMEAYGLYVTGVTKTTELQYYYGPGTIAYVGCCLF